MARPVMGQLRQMMAGEGMDRMSGLRGLKWFRMWGPGAWKDLLEVRVQCLWTNELCPVLCAISPASRAWMGRHECYTEI